LGRERFILGRRGSFNRAERADASRRQIATGTILIGRRC
jgi:hypothetical protein